jgi:protein phosphatase
MTLFLRYAAKSDVGIVRHANEDSGFAGRTLLAVADGMGGHAAGELASATAIATMAELDSADLPTADLLTALDDAILTSAQRISQFIEADPSRSGMGTTLTAILWQAGRIALIHVGDSRAYLLRDDELSQITHDHTYVQSLIDAGRITPEQARTHPKRNLLLRAIDGSQVPEGETSVREAQRGDRYLLCSDGLSGVVPDEAIADVLRSVPDPTAAVTALVDLALEAGAPDNVTAVVADVVEAEAAEVAREASLVSPVVVGAAGEQRNRAALPGLQFPDDVGRADGAGDDAGVPVGPAVVGGLAALGADRGAALPGDALPERPATPAGSLGEAIESGALPVGTAAAAAAAIPGVALLDPAAEPGGAAGPVPPDDGRPGFVRRNAAWLAVVALAVAGLLVGVAGFLWWLGSQWFVGSHSGYVTVFQGVPQTLVGMPLSRVTSQTALEVADLPYYDQTQVLSTIEAATRAEADRIVVDLEKKAAACTGDPVPLGCPVPAPEGSTATPSASASAAPVRSTASPSR